MQGVVTFDGLIITANYSMNSTSAYGLNYTITFSAASISGITSWDVPINIRYTHSPMSYTLQAHSYVRSNHSH